MKLVGFIAPSTTAQEQPIPVTFRGCGKARMAQTADTTIYDTGTLVGRGRQDYINTGLQWTVGPYRFRGMLGFQNYSGGNNAVNSAALRGDPSGRVFLIAHDLFIWSPKGFLTGSASTPGSILFGTHFERNSMRCNNCPTINGGQFHRERVLLREWDLWYFVAPSMSVGANFGMVRRIESTERRWPGAGPNLQQGKRKTRSRWRLDERNS